MSDDGNNEDSGIGGNIRRARVAAGIATQTELAKRLGVPQPQLSDWENGRYASPDLSTLLKIAATIPCSLDALVRGVDTSYDETVIARSDLIGQPVDQISDPSRGSDVTTVAATHARIQHEYDSLLAAAIDVAYQLSTALVERGVDVSALAHDAATGARKPAVRKRPRKAG